jgi:hypothetical protein
MSCLHHRRFSALAALCAAWILGCSAETKPSLAGGASGAGGAGGAGGASATTSSSTGGSTTTTTASSSGTGGALPSCVPPDTKLAELLEPDPRFPWRGAVNIIPKTATKGVPVAGWRVDSTAMPTPKPTTPYSVLDTRKLPDGLHALSLDIVAEGGEIVTVDTPFCVNNGPTLVPALQGQFIDITEASGLPKGNGPEGAGLFFFGAIAGDLDGDGDDDLFNWNFSGGRVYTQVAPMTFAPKGPMYPGMRAAGMADLDGDGDLDLVAAGKGLVILRNDDGFLLDVTAGSGSPVDDGGAWNNFKSVSFADIDQDGLLDVIATQMNCTSGANVVLRNEGDLHFADVAKALSLDQPDGATWGISADLLEDGSTMRVVLYYEAWCKPGLVDYHHLLPGPDLPLPGDFEQQRLRGISPMGQAWLDADGDGLLDQWLSAHVTNPLWRAPDFQTTVGAYVGMDVFANEESIPYAGWGMVVLDADLDGKTDVYVAHDPVVVDPMETPEGSRDGLYWQREPGSFDDIAPLAGLTGIAPCRSAFGSDLDSDGDTDLLLGCRGFLRVLRNDLVSPTAGRTLVLHGKVSNPNGVHTLVTTPTGEKRLVSASGQPFGGGVQQHSVRAPNGQLSLRWPSGIEQKVDAGSARVLHVTEPSALVVSPRRVAAGSGQSVSVQVDPGATGDPGAQVSVVASEGLWSKPMTKEADGLWRGTLTPPAQLSTVVFTVTIGERTLGVRPRVFVR